MKGLVTSEVRRLLSRRVARFLLLLAAAGIVAAGVGRFVTSSRNVEEARERARVDVEECERQLESVRREHPDEFAGSPEGSSPCGRVSDQVQAYDRTFRYADEVTDITRGLAVAGLFLAFVVGASFAGAEWASGSMGMLLTWESRRGRVLVAKLAGAFVVLTLAVFALLGLFALVHLPAVWLRGTTEGMTWGFWRSLVGVWGRGGLLGGTFACAGVAAATLLRNTAGAVGAGLAYGALVDPLLGVWREGLIRAWLFQRNIAQFLGFPVEVRQGATLDGQILDGGFSFSMRVLPVWRPALLLSLYVLLVTLGAYASFRARDVT